MGKPIFIISFDCEGKWGVSDRLTSYHDSYITNHNLIIIYQKLVKLLSKYEIIGTFAFVGALTLSEQECSENKDLFSPRLFNGSNWLEPFLNQYNIGNTDGWLCPEIFDIISNASHEIATHGFCHVPFSEGAISLDAIKNELTAINAWRKIKGVRANTLVFPRNIIGFKIFAWNTL